MKKPLDPVKIFLTYMAFAGDVKQTALVLQLDPSVVSGLEAEGNWKSKTGELAEVAQGKDPGQFKLGVNRAVNYVQAYRLRSLVDKLIVHLEGLEGVDLIKLLTQTGRNGDSFSTRPITDLVKASAEAQLMTRLALGDVGAGELAEESKASSDIALSVMKAMNAATSLKMNPKQLIDELP